MAADFNGLRTTKAALDALLEKLRVITWKGEKAFARVELFVATDLVAALLKLFVTDPRTCLVVFGDKDFDSKVEGTQLNSKQARTVFVLVTDKRIGDDSGALFGTEGNPGAIGLSDLVETEAMGLLLPNPKAIYAAPLHTEILKVTDKDQKNLAGRWACVVTVEINGGLLVHNLGKGPIQ